MFTDLIIVLSSCGNNMLMLLPPGMICLYHNKMEDEYQGIRHNLGQLLPCNISHVM